MPHHVLTALAGLSISAVTYQYDNSRAGWNSNETVLTPAGVSGPNFGRLFSNPVDGYVYAQPLYLPGVRVAGALHNVVYVATEHDSVYAFDADRGGDPLWKVSFLDPASGVTTVPAADTNCGQIIPEIGITGTPVIDVAAGTLFVVAMTRESGAYFHRLHALDVATGAEKPGSPVTIQASVPGTGEGGDTVVFRAAAYKQRPGLLLLNGVVYAAFSSHCDIGQYHGWLIGYDAATLRQVSVYNSTPNGNQGSFWAGGAAPAADSAGNIYVVSGNGTFDYESGGPDLGESYIKLRTAGGGLAVAGYFTPYNYADLNSADADVGSSGVALLPDEAGGPAHPHLLAGGGKEGRLYVLDRDNMGGFNAGADTGAVASLPQVINPLFGNPAYFNKALYLCPADDYLKALPISNATVTATPSSQTAGKFAYPGCVPTISSSGASNGIVWMLESGGALHAFDAADLSRELYRDSPGAYVKFSVPLVANGKVYAATQSSLVVYGLTGSPIAVVNAADGQPGPAAPGGLISIYGSGLAQTMAAAPGFPLPTTLAGASVSIGGLAAPLLYASPGQINAQVPFETPSVTVVVLVGASAAQLAIQPLAPGLFAAVLNPDWSVNGATNPVAVGGFVVAYLTGLGAVDHPVATGAAAPASPLANVTASVTASIGGTPAPVFFAGLAYATAGVYQVNVAVPAMASGDYPLIVTAGGMTSNSVTVSVR
jgi:uncharacterized protein (TIGR03437 family)